MSAKRTPHDRRTISRVVLPPEIFTDPSSADAIALARPEAPPDDTGGRSFDPAPIDFDEYLDKLLARQQADK